jgi:septal ring factor EnvC (AmiA/AmiB activator)
MPDKAKSSLLIFSILILVSLSFAGAGFYLLQKEKMKNFSLREELDSLRIKQNAAETKLEEYKKTISQLEVRLKEAEASIDSLNGALDQETKEKQEAQDQVQQLKSDLEQQKGLRADLETKLSQAQNDAEKMQAQLKDIESKKAKLEARLKELEAQAQPEGQGVELGTIVVGSEGSSASAKQKAVTPLEGKVLVANKDYNFVVINLGSNDGVNAQDVFALYHGNKYIGDIKVEKIHESMSAAGFMSATIKDIVIEGDRVVRKTK